MKTEIAGLILIVFILDVRSHWDHPNDKPAWSLFFCILDRAISFFNFYQLIYLSNVNWYSKICILVASQLPVQIIKHFFEHGILTDPLYTTKQAVGYVLFMLLLFDAVRNYISGSFSKLGWSDILIRYMLKIFCINLIEQKPPLEQQVQPQDQHFNLLLILTLSLGLSMYILFEV